MRPPRGAARAGLILGAVLLASPLAAQDEELDPLEPDFTVVNLPTTLRLPRHGAAFRLTHRFTRPLGQGDFGDLVRSFFGFDSAAQVGLEFRFGLFPGSQLGLYRTNDRAIDFFLKQDVLRQNGHPVGVSIFGAVEGQDNFSKEYSPGVAVVVSRKLGKRAAVYAEPAWVGNTARPQDGPTDHDSTVFVGLGARVRLGSSAYLVGEFAPRLAGFKGTNLARPSERAANHLSFGIEKRVGGHSFQLNFSNYFATTLATIARGADSGDDWHIGFNLSRKFF
ncbi:MAG TPA: DUF5777 family beta-barrel protein [Gemmatimonadales bacterium]|nr:DUF5777 family beta-barrel protein [Gemmatimonadales bacterium]